jgi:hypothetical protein
MKLSEAQRYLLKGLANYNQPQQPLSISERAVAEELIKEGLVALFHTSAPGPNGYAIFSVVAGITPAGRRALEEEKG